MGNSNLSGRFKAKRIEWSEIELKIALAYYYFIYQYNTREKDYESFATDLRKMTNNTRSNGSIGVRFANFAAIDPIKKSSGFSGGNKKCKPIWDCCINEDRSPKEEFIKMFANFIFNYGRNNKVYIPFLNKYNIDFSDVIALSLSESEYQHEVSEKIKSKNYNKEKLLNDNSYLCSYENIRRIKRSTNVAAYTRERAKGICDLCGYEAPFVDKSGVPYLETHHLITLSSGGPDVIYNTVALCPNCHRKIHSLDNTEDKEFLKKVIYKYLLNDEEKEVLKKFEKLFCENEI